MAKRGTATAAPRLRFPEFRSAKAWTTIELRQLSEFVTERVGTTDCTPYTVSSGVGLVSQQEKLGRTIAGNSLKNYIVLQKNDFAYNKSATKAFPQGFIARYVGEDRAAVPNSIFTCFRTNDDLIDPTYLDNLFSTNLHGNWLRNRIAVGARAHGSLNVSDEDLMDLPVPLPAGSSSLTEQQKIANCLTSLDEVIAAQGRKVEALKAHKRGLMQQLFPREGETRPRLRFPEFRDAPEWDFSLLQVLEDKKLIELGRGTVISHDDMRASPGLNPVYSSSVINQGLMGTYAQYMFDEELISWSIDGGGHFFHRAKHRFSVTNVSGFMRVLSSEIVCRFLAYQLQKLHASHTFDYQQKAHPSVIRALYRVGLPSPEEQQRIADSLSSLDTRIAAESHQLAALKTHKQGLMQQLFPAPEAASA